MATFHTTETGTMSVQVRIGGDMALIRAFSKAVIEAAEKDPSVLDREFIEYHTHGFEEYRALVVSTAWTEIVEGSGISEADIRKLPHTYIASKRVIIAWCLAINAATSTASIRCAKSSTFFSCGETSDAREQDRARSAGTATCRATEPAELINRPDAAFLDRLGKVCGITPPREPGLGTVADDRGDATAAR